jgi:hypothetical protein
MPAVLRAERLTKSYGSSRGIVDMTFDVSEGEVVVLDWGLAKVLGRPDKEPHAPPVNLDVAGADSGYAPPCRTAIIRRSRSLQG